MTETKNLSFKVWDSKSLKMYFKHNTFCKNMVMDLSGKLVIIDTLIVMGEVVIDYIPAPKHLIPIQSTGVYDKKGKLIYDGDIVEHSYFGTKVVLWGNSTDAVSLKGMASYMYKDTIAMLNTRDSEELLLIGSQYENPEL